MKKYAAYGSVVDGKQAKMVMVEDPDGIWITWENHLSEIARITEVYERRLKELNDTWEHAVNLGKKDEAYDTYHQINDLKNEMSDLKSGLVRHQANHEDNMTIRGLDFKPPKISICNCQRKADLMFSPGEHIQWVCPVHGYKKR